MSEHPYRSSANPHSLRERRRYQLAKDILLLALDTAPVKSAEWEATRAVKYADALLDALDAQAKEVVAP
jgi:hypothetical protein